MCTVTLVPKGEADFVLTSNRDEAPGRLSFPPNIYTIDKCELLFPKDEVSGGTWIGASEQHRVVCVLNGGFDLHERQSSYRLSRGIVALDFMLFENLEKAVKLYNFEGIEPFTMVIVDWNNGLKFYELVWDGHIKHFKLLPKEEAIWSSSTLYTRRIKNIRVEWFDNFKLNNELKPESLLQFHKTAGQGNLDYGVKMNRGFVKTTSITQIEKSKHLVKMYYENFHNDFISNTTFNLSEIINE